MSRNKKQYNAFRKSFKKWLSTRRLLGITKVEFKESGMVYVYTGLISHVYAAPDYMNYMNYILRKYLPA